MAEYDITSGITSTGLTLNGDDMHISKGGMASDTILDFNGSMYVSYGGKAEKTTVNGYAEMDIYEGGLASSTTVNSGGRLTVSSGGTATEILENGGCVSVADDADVTFAVNTFSGLILSQYSASIHSGTTAVSTTLGRDGRLFVYSGGIADNTTVDYRGTLNVSSGGTANSTLLAYNSMGYGSMNIYSGGMANDTVIDWGTLAISGGGTAVNTVLQEGGGAIIESDGIADSVMVGGVLNVSSGGTALNVRENGGIVNVAKGASVTFLSNTFSGLKLDIGSATIHSGTTAVAATITSKNASLLIFDGGVAENTVNSGQILVSSGGTANGTINSGRLTVSSGGTADGTTFEGGDFRVMAGGTANSTTLNGSGMNVSGSADHVVVNVGGGLSVNAGGTATNIIENGGYVSFAEGADVTFASNTIYDLSLLGQRTSTTVHSGTTVCNAFIGSGAGKTMIIYSGGKLTGKIIVSGGAITAKDGAIIDFDLTTVAPGAAARIDSMTLSRISGTPTYTITVNADQTEGIYRLVEGMSEFDRTITVVNTVGTELGTLTVGETTDVSGVGYTLSLSEDGVLSLKVGETDTPSPYTSDGLIVDRNNPVDVSSGQVFHDVSIVQGGRMTVSGGGVLDGVDVISNGSLTVSGGGTATNIVENGGYVSVEDGAEVSFVPHAFTLGNSSFNGMATVHSGTTAYNNYGGTFHVYSGGVANNNRGGTFHVYSGGVANNNGGTFYVYNGGVANSATIVSDDGEGYAYVSSGGMINGTILSGGTIFLSGGTANNTVFDNNGRTAGSAFLIVAGGVANNTVVRGNIQNQEKRDHFLVVCSGGTANNTIVNAGGRLDLWYGSGLYGGSGAGEANDTIVNLGGTIGVISGTANRTTVYSGGEAHVFSSGVANDTIVSSGGKAHVYSCGVANDTIVSSGGCLDVSLWEAGGTANGIVVHKGGTVNVGSDGTVTGKLMFEEGAVVSMTEGAVLDFDLTQAEAGADALVNDLSIIQGTPLYTLTVDTNRDWTPGTYDYTLANGAADFDGTISVVSIAGDELGMLTVGETVRIGYNDYTLNLLESALSVTIEAPDLTPQATVGTAEQVSWEATGADQYIVEYSTDNFEHVIQIVTTASATDMLELPAGTYQWRVKADENSDWAVGESIVSEVEPDTPKVVQAVEDGSDDLFFAAPSGTWSDIFFARHEGSVNDWTGTREGASANGKGRIRNLFFGTADPNVLCLTDAENGDGIFVDDIYTDLPDEVAEHTARLYRIREIRAGAGDDIVDMTSQRFEYTGDGLTIRGGDGSDVIWANKGDNMLFGDDGNDRIVGASGSDVIVGGIGNDSLHGGGGEDTFIFCDNWGVDTVEQLESGTITLWFANGDESNWNAETLTYADGENRVTVSGVSAEQITLKFGDDGSEQFAALSNTGAFDAFASRRIFEESDSGILAGV